MSKFRHDCPARKQRGNAKGKEGTGQEQGKKEKRTGKQSTKKGQGRNEAEGTGAERKGKGEGKDSNKSNSVARVSRGTEPSELRGKCLVALSETGANKRWPCQKLELSRSSPR